jgi:hypothetical protein
MWTCTCHCLIANTNKIMFYKVQNLSPTRIPNEQWPTLWRTINVTITKSNKTVSIYTLLRSRNCLAIRIYICIFNSEDMKDKSSHKENITFRDRFKGLEFSYGYEKLEPMVTPNFSGRICYKYLSFTFPLTQKNLLCAFARSSTLNIKTSH